MSGSNRTLGPFPAYELRAMVERHFRHSTKLGPPFSWVKAEEAENWCRQQCGTPNAVSRVLCAEPNGQAFLLNCRKRWCSIDGTFYFQEKNEAFAFRLRWG